MIIPTLYENWPFWQSQKWCSEMKDRIFRKLANSLTQDKSIVHINSKIDYGHSYSSPQFPSNKLIVFVIICLYNIIKNL